MANLKGTDLDTDRRRLGPVHGSPESRRQQYFGTGRILGLSRLGCLLFEG